MVITDPDMNGNNHDALVLFADISGFTSYIRENQWTQAHAIDAIHKLLDAVIDRLEPDFSLAKLEGDAAFCHMPLKGKAPEGTNLATMLTGAFTAFSARQAELASRNHCQCLACRGLEKLQLKIILHGGNISMNRTRLGWEPGGLPVIVLHRLSKNSVQAHRYVMWTDPVTPYLSFNDPVVTHTEYCDGIGSVKVFVHTQLPGNMPVTRAGAFTLFLDFITKAWLWLPLNLRRAPGKKGAFVQESKPPSRDESITSQQNH
jgi:hypothetical protein